jgi:uncharacterized phage-associated protein
MILREQAAFSPFEFDRLKAIETVLYVARKAPIPDRFHVCKIIYFADKYHLTNYGRFIFGDHYAAMKNGPVPSGAYDIIKAAGDGKIPELRTDDLDVIALRDADAGVFSESDMEALDNSIAQYGNEPFNRLSLMSHDDAWNITTEKGRLVEDGTSIPIEFTRIAGMMQHGDALLKYVEEYY